MNNIVVKNLSPNVSAQDVRAVFEKYGEVARFKVMTDRRTGEHRGFGFIQMKNDEAAERALAALDGTEMDGKPLQVNAARPQLHHVREKRS